MQSSNLLHDKMPIAPSCYDISGYITPSNKNNFVPNQCKCYFSGGCSPWALPLPSDMTAQLRRQTDNETKDDRSLSRNETDGLSTWQP